MLYYYRGLLYLESGDYQNARASFLAADRHDMLGADETYASDFGIMKYLAGWASRCDGDTARGEQLIREAKAADPLIAGFTDEPPRSLILIDSGAGPAKYGEGEYKHILKFKPGAREDDAVTITGGDGGTPPRLTLAGDVTHQAMTRGGREVDGILAGKASFKETAGTVGSVGLTAGSNVAMMGAAYGNRDAMNAGMIGMFIGLVAKGVEAAANPQADVRRWDSLPAKLMVALVDELPAQGGISQAGQADPVPLTLTARHGACSVGWGRAAAATSEAQGVFALSSADVEETKRGDRNRLFRAMLGETFRADRIGK
jgi:hypothetical protein